jgi:hypothetical protein
MFTRNVLRRFLAALIALSALLITRPAAAEEEKADDGPLLIAQLPAKPAEPATYELRYKLKRGDVLRYEVTDRASFTTTIEQSTSSTQTKTVTVKAWKVIDVLPDGNIEFMNVIERVKMVNQLPDHEPVEYDSELDKTPPPGFEDIARSIGVPLVAVTMTPHGEVVVRDWKVRAPRAEENAPIAVRLPDGPVAVGESWDEPYDPTVMLEDQTTKTIQTRRHHKLLDVANGIARIEVTYQVLSPIDAFVEYQLVQRLMHGEVRFDIDAGRILDQQMDIDKRILGFAGPASSTHYIMRMEEKLLKADPQVTSRPAAQTTTTSRGPNARTRPGQTANRPAGQKTTRRARR